MITVIWAMILTLVLLNNKLSIQTIRKSRKLYLLTFKRNRLKFVKSVWELVNIMLEAYI